MGTNSWRLCSLLFISGVVSPALANDSLGKTSPAGEASFARACATCHGAKGEGGKGPPVAPLIYTEPQVLTIVRGGQGEMPPIPKATLTDAEISAIVAYLSATE